MQHNATCLNCSSIIFKADFISVATWVHRFNIWNLEWFCEAHVVEGRIVNISRGAWKNWNINRGGVICCWPRVVQYTWSVMGHQTRNCSWRIATTRQLLSVCNMWAIECRPSHLYEYLWCHYFRMRNIVTLVSPAYFCLRVDMIHHSHPYW